MIGMSVRDNPKPSVQYEYGGMVPGQVWDNKEGNSPLYWYRKVHELKQYKDAITSDEWKHWDKHYNCATLCWIEPAEGCGEFKRLILVSHGWLEEESIMQEVGDIPALPWSNRQQCHTEWRCRSIYERNIPMRSACRPASVPRAFSTLASARASGNNYACKGDKRPATNI